MSVNSQVNGLVDFLYGKESQDDAVGVVARFVAAHSQTRPAAGTQSRWPDIVSMKTHALHYGPNVTAAQIDAALAAAGIVEPPPRARQASEYWP